MLCEPEGPPDLWLARPKVVPQEASVDYPLPLPGKGKICASAEDGTSAYRSSPELRQKVVKLSLVDGSRLVPEPTQSFPNRS